MLVRVNEYDDGDIKGRAIGSRGGYKPTCSYYNISSSSVLCSLTCGSWGYIIYIIA